MVWKKKRKAGQHDIPAQFERDREYFTVFFLPIPSVYYEIKRAINEMEVFCY